jgi:hypothetical protein
MTTAAEINRICQINQLISGDGVKIRNSKIQNEEEIKGFD